MDAEKIAMEAEKKRLEAEAAAAADAEMAQRVGVELAAHERKRQERSDREFATIYQIQACSSMSMDDIARDVEEKNRRDLEEERAQQLALREKMEALEYAQEKGLPPPVDAACVVPTSGSEVLAVAQTVDTDECECLGKPKEKETPFEARLRMDREAMSDECGRKEAAKCCTDCLVLTFGCIDECIAKTCCNLTLNEGSFNICSIWWIWLISMFRRIFSLSPIFIGVWNTVSNIRTTGNALVTITVPREFKFSDTVKASSYYRALSKVTQSTSVMQCEYGNPSALQMSCDPSIYTLYTALIVLWMLYFSILFLFHLFFSWKYSPFDLRYYVSLQKANKSPFNAHFVNAGLGFTAATTIVGLYYVYKLEHGNMSAAFTAASSILQFSLVNIGVLIPFTSAMFNRVRDLDMDDFSQDIWSANPKKCNSWEGEENRKKFEKKFGRRLHKHTALADKGLLSWMSHVADDARDNFSSAEEGVVFRGSFIKGHARITGVELTPELSWFLYETNEEGELASPPVLKSGENRVFVTAEAGLSVGTVVIQVEGPKLQPSGIYTVNLLLNETCVKTVDNALLDFYDKGSYPFQSLPPTRGCISLLGLPAKKSIANFYGCALTVESVFSEIKDLMVATHLYNKRHNLHVELLDRIGDGAQILETMELMYVYDNPEFPQPTQEMIEAVEKKALYKAMVAKAKRSAGLQRAAEAIAAANKEAMAKADAAFEKRRQAERAAETKSRLANINAVKGKDAAKYQELLAEYEREVEEEAEMEEVFRSVEKV